MIIIYTQDFTAIKADIIQAREVLLSVYGDKLGQEVYEKLKNSPIGTGYQKYGGPLIKVVSKKDAESIREKELAIGMLRE